MDTPGRVVDGVAGTKTSLSLPGNRPHERVKGHLVCGEAREQGPKKGKKWE